MNQRAPKKLKRTMKFLADNFFKHPSRLVGVDGGAFVGFFERDIVIESRISDTQEGGAK